MAGTADFQVIEIEGLPWNAGNIKWCLRQLECTSCGRCCRELSGGVKITYDEVKALAAHLAISNKEFYKTVTKYPDYCVLPNPVDSSRTTAAPSMQSNPIPAFLIPFITKKTVPGSPSPLARPDKSLLINC
jgi:hypothetical protein